MSSSAQLKYLIVAVILVLSTACAPLVTTGVAEAPSQRGGGRSTQVSTSLATSNEAFDVDEAGVPTALPTGASYTDESGGTSTVIEVEGARGLLAPAPRQCEPACPANP